LLYHRPKGDTQPVSLHLVRGLPSMYINRIAQLLACKTFERGPSLGIIVAIENLNLSSLRQSIAGDARRSNVSLLCPSLGIIVEPKLSPVITFKPNARPS